MPLLAIYHILNNFDVNLEMVLVINEFFTSTANVDEQSTDGLPSTVTVLDAPDGGKVYLVGTAHFSLQSQEDVSKVRILLSSKHCPDCILRFLL